MTPAHILSSHLAWQEQVKLAPSVERNLEDAHLWRALKFISVVIKPFDQASSNVRTWQKG